MDGTFYWLIGSSFLLGLMMGSFYNVCIYRLPQGESVVLPGSHCPNCSRPIRWYDNIPLISYLILGGKCRFCREAIHWRYPLIELLTGIGFAAIVARFGLSLVALKHAAFFSLLLIISAIDIDKKLILNKLSLPGVVLGAVLSYLGGDGSPLGILAGIAGCGGLLILISLFGNLLFGKESMGMGDVKLGAMIGAFVGFSGGAISIFFGFLVAALISAGGMILGRLSRDSYVPFGPFLAGGALIYIFWGSAIVDWYLRTVGLR